MSYVSKAISGAHIFGTAIQPSPNTEWSAALALVLGTQVDEELRCMVFYQRFGVAPTCQEDLQKPEVDVLLERCKNFVRAQVQQVFREAAAQDEEDRRQQVAQANSDHQDHQRPHELGTVAEIAARHGISKSEVRRLKAQGALHTLKT